jgi:hypothetical protein
MEDALNELWGQAVLLIGGILLTFLTALLARAMNTLNTKWGVQIDAERRAALEAALTNAINLAIERAGSAKPAQIIDYLRTYNAGTLDKTGLAAEPTKLLGRVEAAIASKKLDGTLPSTPALVVPTSQNEGPATRGSL